MSVSLSNAPVIGTFLLLQNLIFGGFYFKM